jgi:hypothetical protein
MASRRAELGNERATLRRDQDQITAERLHANDYDLGTIV